MLYKSLFVPHINYWSLVWGQNCNSINKMQRKAIRTVTHSNYIAHSEPLLKDLYLLSVKDLMSLKLIKFLYKLYHNNLPIYFNDYMPHLENVKQGITYVHHGEKRSKKVPHIVKRAPHNEKNVAKRPPYNGIVAKRPLIRPQKLGIFQVATAYSCPPPPAGDHGNYRVNFKVSVSPKNSIPIPSTFRYFKFPCIQTQNTII